MGIKRRILLFASSREPNIEAFSLEVFGTPDFFSSDQELTVDYVLKLATAYPNLNINWIFRGKGLMTISPPDENQNYSERDFMTPEEVLIEALEEELRKKQQIIDELKGKA